MLCEALSEILLSPVVIVLCGIYNPSVIISISVDQYRIPLRLRSGIIDPADRAGEKCRLTDGFQGAGDYYACQPATKVEGSASNSFQSFGELHSVDISAVIESFFADGFTGSYHDGLQT